MSNSLQPHGLKPEYWCGQPFPSPGDLPNPGIKPRSPTLQVDSLPAEPQGKLFPKEGGKEGVLERIPTSLVRLFFFKFCLFVCFMWSIFKVFIEFITILLLVYILVSWPPGFWDLSFPTRD